MAGLFNNQSRRLADLGRREEALDAIDRAVDLYRRLVEARPKAFLPDLAMALNNLSGCLAGLGRREEALDAIDEAVDVDRRLAEARPDAFLPDLAMTLNNRSRCLAGLGRREEALDAIDEAIRLILPLLARTPYVLPDAGPSALARKFGDVSASGCQAASDAGCGVSSLASSLLRSARVNFHSNGAAICS